MTDTASAPTEATRAHFPGLDGLRGLAVVMVLLFHQGYGWAQGGFLGVPMFFALSGFLITTLLLAEHERTGRIALGRFLARRARRLAPASVTVALAIAVVWLVVEGNTAAPSIGPDLLASLAKVTNWWFIVDEQSYGDLFAAPTPYLHYWSLAIEEQLYLLWPLALIAILRLGSSRGRVIAASAVTLVSLSFTFVHDSFDWIYYGTHVRAAELLIGAVLALAVVGRTERLAAQRTRRSGLLSRTSWLALAAIVALFATQAQSSALWRNGGLAGVAALSAVLVVGAIVPGAMRTVMSHPFLVWLGAASYGIYLVHWPVFVLLTPSRTDLPGWTVFPVRLAATLVIAVLIDRLVERPIRFRRTLRRPASAALVYAAVAVTGALAAVAITASVDEPADTVSAAGPQIFVSGSDASTASDGDSGATTSPTAPPPERLTVLVVGSTASIEPFEPDAGLALDLVDRRAPGCPLVDAVEVVGAVVREDLRGCPRADGWADALADTGADAVLVTVGTPDTGRVRVAEADEVLTRIETRAHLLDTLRNAVRDLRSTDVPILLAAEPELGGADRRQTDDILDVVALTDPRVRVGPSPATLDGSRWVRSTLDELLGTDAGADRVLVLGDSTGASLSRLIFEETEGTRETVGLAQEGCPLIPVDEIRWWDEVQFDLATCPTVEDIRSYADSFRPSTVLLSSSLMEQADLRVADGDWFEPTSPDFVALHDLYMAELQQAFAAVSTAPVIWVLDSPAIDSGAFSDSPMARPERIAAWNDQIDRWADTWVNVRRVPWSAAVAALEQSVGSIRPDGVHIDGDHLRRLVIDVVIPTLDADAPVRRDMRAAGCIGTSPDVDRCRR